MMGHVGTARDFSSIKNSDFDELFLSKSLPQHHFGESFHLLSPFYPKKAAMLFLEEACDMFNFGSHFSWQWAHRPLKRVRCTILIKYAYDSSDVWWEMLPEVFIYFSSEGKLYLCRGIIISQVVAINEI